MNESVRSGTAESSVEDLEMERARKAYVHASLKALSFISFTPSSVPLNRGDGGGARKHILPLLGL